jgi:hypothetical protein
MGLAEVGSPLKLRKEPSPLVDSALALDRHWRIAQWDYLMV